MTTFFHSSLKKSDHVHTSEPHLAVPETKQDIEESLILFQKGRADMLALSKYTLFVATLAMALALTAPSAAIPENQETATAVLRTRKCPTYCFVGKTGKIQRKCASFGTVPCTRKASKGRRSRLLKGLKCNCPKKPTPSNPSDPDPMPSPEDPEPPMKPDELPKPDREMTVSCGTTLISGPEAVAKAIIKLGATSGVVALSYKHYFIKDRIRVVYEGEVVYDSGFVRNSKTVKISYGGASSKMEVYVNGPPHSSAWCFKLGCP